MKTIVEEDADSADCSSAEDEESNAAAHETASTTEASNNTFHAHTHAPSAASSSSQPAMAQLSKTATSYDITQQKDDITGGQKNATVLSESPRAEDMAEKASKKLYYEMKKKDHEVQCQICID
jgi:phage repressor protein C with HTH and peptisase S24 domain